MGKTIYTVYNKYSYLHCLQYVQLVVPTVDSVVEICWRSTSYEFFKNSSETIPPNRKIANFTYKLFGRSRLIIQRTKILLTLTPREFSSPVALSLFLSRLWHLGLWNPYKLHGNYRTFHFSIHDIQMLPAVTDARQLGIYLFYIIKN